MIAFIDAIKKGYTGKNQERAKEPFSKISHMPSKLLLVSWEHVLEIWRYGLISAWVEPIPNIL